MRKMVLCLASACALAGPANAVVASAVRVTNAFDTWLQISEVVATQAFTGADVALATAGATATSSGSYQGYDSSGYAIDGEAPAAYPNIYHSSGGGAFLLVSFAHSFDLSGLALYGRADCYCYDRDRFNYELLDSRGATILSGVLDARNEAHMDSVSFAVDAVPEPASWAMMLGGFALAGAMLRRRAPLPSRL